VIYILGIITAVLVGGLIKYLTDRTGSTYQITRNELIIGAVVCSLVVVPVTVWAGTKVAIGNNLTYHEYWSGYETRAVMYEQGCSRDSGCTYTYDCDPYDVWVDTSYTDSNGNRVSDGHWETHYHSCPYSTVEQSFVVKTTLGDYGMGTRVPYGAAGFRGRGIPNHVPRGEPRMWAEAKARLDAGDHGPVTKRADYDNYILASQETILKESSTAIAKYKKDGLLPKLTSDVYDYYLANKVYTAGMKLNNRGNWVESVNRFNAAFGSDLQGDLHLVVFDLKDIDDPDEYSQALYAYWTSSAFKKDALSKNALVVFLGTRDGVTVEWASASTGMPVGNTQLLQELRSELRGLTLSPDAVIGNPRPKFKGEDLTIELGGGILELAVWGTNKFERVSMSGSGKDDNGTGFGYLVNNVELTGVQKFAIFFISLLTSGVVWGILVAVGDTRHRRYW